MYGFFGRLANTFRRFMQGRYGLDALGRLLLIVGFSLSLLSWIRPLSFLYIPATVILFMAYFRCFSRNFYKRQCELAAYMKIHNKISGKIALSKRRASERKTHKFFKCRTCKAQLRVPRGKGKIEITCPKCRTKTIKRT